MTDGELLAHIIRLPHGKATLKQILKEMRARTEHRGAIERSLDRLAKRGDLIELKSGHYIATAKSREYMAGRISRHRDGYGFLIADKPIPGIKGDIFLPPESLRGAMHGDRAVARVSGPDRDGRAEGAIVKIVKRAHPTVVGEFRITKRGMFVEPYDARLREWIEIPDELAIPDDTASPHRIGAAPVAIADPSDLDGMVVNVEILEYAEDVGTRHESAPVGKVVEVLGKPGDFGVDVEIIIRKHHLPHRFPAEAIEQAQGIPLVITAEEMKGRRDFRDMPIVTIDGETARDFDDAVWVDKLPGGRFALHVHIADVSHYVRPGSQIDDEARLRGTSVYFPDRAVPMLPYELSTDICSLLPQKDRLVMSALMEFDAQGELVAGEFCRGVIRSADRMTYTNVHLLLEGDAGQRERYAPLVDRFETMRELALILNRKRVKRGSIDFDLPEPLIEFDEFGAMKGVLRSVRNIAHRIIEEFMLAANEAVAEHLESVAETSIYRIHEQPDPKRVLEFEEVAAQFGVSLGVGAIPVDRFRYSDKRRDGAKKQRTVELPKDSVRITSRMYQKLVAKIEGKPEERVLSYLMLRSLKQARYSTDNPGHFALAAKYYTHFTSPIRRYPDLLVHRLLGAWLDADQSTGKQAYLSESELQSAAEDCSLTERRAAEAERELVEWKKARFMESRVGDEFDGLVISITRHGMFVELADLFVEGLVPIDSLPGDHFAYYENVRKIVGQRTRREFSIGDRVRVLLERVEPAERKLQFSLVEEEIRRSERRSKGKTRRSEQG
jgi:ribonuclease R